MFDRSTLLTMAAAADRHDKTHGNHLRDLAKGKRRPRRPSITELARQRMKADANARSHQLADDQTPERSEDPLRSPFLQPTQKSALTTLPSVVDHAVARVHGRALATPTRKTRGRTFADVVQRARRGGTAR